MIHKIILIYVAILTFSINTTNASSSDINDEAAKNSPGPTSIGKSQEIDLYKGYLNLKKAKKEIINYQDMGFEEKHYRLAINSYFLEVLENLRTLGEQNVHKAKCRYFRLAENIFDKDVPPHHYKKILKQKAKFRDEIISYYQGIIDFNHTQQNLDAKYKIAKYIWWSYNDDPGHKRKLKFSGLMQELKSKNYLKAFYLDYKLTLDPKPLQQAKQIENKEKYLAFQS